MEQTIGQLTISIKKKRPEEIIIFIKETIEKIIELLLQSYPTEKSQTDDKIEFLSTVVYKHITILRVSFDFLFTIDENVAHQHIYQDCMASFSPSRFADEIRILKVKHNQYVITRTLDRGKMRKYSPELVTEFDALVEKDIQESENDRFRDLTNTIDAFIIFITSTSMIFQKL